MSIPAAIDLVQLRKLLSTLVEYQGAGYRIVDVVEEPMALVLESVERGGIQNDQYGNPSRRSASFRLIPIFSTDSHAYSDAFKIIYRQYSSDR